MTSAETLRFHIDARGRILMENVTRACLEVARALAPEDPVIRELLARAEDADRRRQHAGRRKDPHGRA